MSLNSQECYFVLRHISFNIQWISFVYFAFWSHLIYTYFVLLLFEQSSPIYTLFSFLFLFTVTKPFSSFKVFFFTIYSVGDKCNVQLTYIHRWKIGVKHEQINRKKRTRANETQKKKRFGLEMVLAKLAAVRDTLSINNIGRRKKKLTKTEH